MKLRESILAFMKLKGPQKFPKKDLNNLMKDVIQTS